MTDNAGGRPLSTPGARLSVRTEPHPGGRVLVLRLDGEIANATAGLLREHAISAALSTSPPLLILDLATFCAASRLGTLVAIRNAVLDCDGVLVAPGRRRLCRRILHRTGLDLYIPVTATLDRAITHLIGLAW